MSAETDRQPLRLPSQIDGLDGVRGLAGLLILFFHGFYGTMEPFFEAPRIWTGFGHWILLITEPLSGGVDIFFVLSGFLITRTLFASSNGNLTKKDILYFYGRRLARLYPLYLILMLVLLAMGLSFSFVVLATLFLGNVADLFDFPSLWLPIWSIAVEIHFYLIWPLFLKLGGKKSLALISLLLVLISPVLRAWGFEHGGNIYSHTWFRLDGLAAGSFLAYLVFEKRFSLRFFRSLAHLGILLFLLILFFRPALLNRTVAEGQIYACEIWQILGAALICGAISEAKIFSFLKSRALVQLGLWSYGIFLIHPVLFDLWRRGETSFHISQAEMGWVFFRAIAVSALSIGLARESFLRFEKPTYRKIVESLAPKRI